MKTALPWYQSAILHLPFGRHRAARTLGLLMKRKLTAVVNQATFRLDLQETIQRLMFLESYEPIETGWLKECVGEGDTFIDVGANFGHYTTLAASRVGPHGRVFAFEPSPVANGVIEEMIEASAISNVVLIKAAVGKSNGLVDLFMPTTSELHSPSIMQSDPDFVPFQVPVIALDAFEPFDGIGPIKLIKIDVEGYEPDVLEGMARMIAEGRVLNVFCEFNSWWLARNGTTSEQLMERFLDSGFEINKQTDLQENIVGHHGVLFNLQDVWLSLRKK